jgi:hypothetical protein
MEKDNMAMNKTQSQINPQNPNEQKERVWMACRASSAKGFAGEGGCGGQEAYVIRKVRGEKGHHVSYQCVRCGGGFSISY